MSQSVNEAWCTDITYYLPWYHVITSRKIAWTLSKTLEVEEVLKCIEMARKQKQQIL